MKSTILKISFAAILATGFLTSCSTVNNMGGNTETTNTTSILGKWELSHVNSMKAATLAEAYPMGVPYLNFVSTNMLNASDGCNTLNGGVTISGNEITFGNMMSTMKACENVEDSNFSSKLNGKLKYSISDNKLLLIQDDIVVMTFVRPGNLAGSWELEEFITSRYPPWDVPWSARRPPRWWRSTTDGPLSGWRAGPWWRSPRTRTRTPPDGTPCEDSRPNTEVGGSNCSLTIRTRIACPVPIWSLGVWTRRSCTGGEAHCNRHGSPWWTTTGPSRRRRRPSSPH